MPLLLEEGKNMTVELVWQDPPRRSGGTSTDYARIIESLKANPGRWALITADWKTSGPPAAFRQNGCDVTTRRNKNTVEGKKTWSVYARYPVKVTPPPAGKAHVDKAIATGTALKPPSGAPHRQSRPPANDMGLSSFLAERRARGAVDVPE